MNAAQRLLREADWHAQESERLRATLDAMTNGHKDAIGPQAVRRVEVDAETHQQLAAEYRAHVRSAYPEELEEISTDDAGLF